MSIIKILKEHYVDGACHTHVSMIDPKGKFQFSRQTLETFWKLYCDSVLKGETLGIAEKSQTYLPVLVDVDLKVQEDDDIIIGSNLYTDENVCKIIEIYQSVLRNIVEDCTDQDLMCILLEKPMYRETKNGFTYVKNGFHLQFFNLFLSKTAQETQLIPRVKYLMKEQSVFEDIGIEDSSSVIDDAVCKVPWLLYGSSKSEEKKSYKVTKVYDANRYEISLEDAFKHHSIYDSREHVINTNGKIEYYLPRILSIIPFGRDSKELRSGLISITKEKMKARIRKEDKVFEKVSVTTALKTTAKLLPMLALHRVEDRNEWMSIGWALFNIGEGCDEALDQWIEFSRQDETKFDEDYCIDQWSKMTSTNLSMGTIKWYAKLDNPEQYKKFVDEETKKYVKDSIQGSHNDIAKILYSEYGNDFVCASIKPAEWYQFINHKWEPVEEGIFLRMKISNELVEKYKELGKEIYEHMEIPDDGDMTQHNKKTSSLNKIIQNMKSAPFKANVMKEAMELFYDKRFKKKLNKDKYLIAFTNGVYDLRVGDIRAGRPEDFLSKCLPVEYKEFTENDENVKEVRKYFEQVFPDTSVRKYFLDKTSNVFVGGNPEKIGLFWTGDGDNAKSVTQTIFEKMLGPFAVKLPTTVLTGKKPTSGSAYADLARTGDGVRWVVTEEPNADEEINAGPFKHYTGNDSYLARDLFEKGKEANEITPLYKFSVICNKLPRIKYADKATFNRIRVIPFESTFVSMDDENPPAKTYEEQLRQKRFPKDPTFTNKIPDMLPAFTWVLLEHRKNITSSVEPEKVKVATEMYKKQNDTYRQFIDENIITDKTTISLVELYSQFREWFKESLPGQQLPVKNDVKDYFIKIWGEPEPGIKWIGYRIRTVQDDIMSGNAVEMTDDDFIEYDK